MQVLSLALFNGSRIQCCHELWCRSQTGLDLVLLWLWYRPAARAPIRPLAWELPYAVGVVLKRPKKKKFLAGYIMMLSIYSHVSDYQCKSLLSSIPPLLFSPDPSAEFCLVYSPSKDLVKITSAFLPHS